MRLEFEAVRQLGRFTYDAALTADSEIVVLFGHSGAGKSVTLQLVAGLMRPDRGRVVISGDIAFDSARGIDLPPQRRRVGYVVQSLAVFPHMDVAANIAFGMAGTRSERRERVAELLDLMGLAGYEHRKPASLSGGQLQRVALARAIGRDATLLLLDEPFSALDESLRETMRRELQRLRAELGLTILFVTHDLREAHLLADRLAVFDEGRILQLDAREEVFRRPTGRRVAELTGVRNVFTGELAGRTESGPLVRVGPCTWQCGSAADGVAALAPGAPVDVAIRPERINLRRGDIQSTPGANLVEAAIVDDLAYGAAHTLRLRTTDGRLAFEVDIASRPYEVLEVASHREWLVEFPPADLHVMPVESR